MDEDDNESILRWIEELEEEEKAKKALLPIGPLAEQQLRRFTNKDEADTTYGLYDKKGKFYIGNEEIEILGDDILFANKTYEGTPGLWELIIAKKPDKDKYDDEDFDNYKEIMLKSGTLHKNNDKDSHLPKSSKAFKWKKILKNFWLERLIGKGITIIPSDPNALLERLDLLMASKGAGNTGVRNELVSICDELKRQHVLNTKTYKKLMSIL